MEPFFNILFNLETNEEIITYKKMLKKGDTYYSYYLLEPKQKPLGSFLLDFLNTDMHKRKNVEKFITEYCFEHYYAIFNKNYKDKYVNYTFTISNDMDGYIGFETNSNNDTYKELCIKDLQIELGDKKTNYEEFKYEMIGNVIINLEDKRDEIATNDYYIKIYKEDELVQEERYEEIPENNIVKNEVKTYATETGKKYVIQLSIKIKEREYLISKIEYSTKETEEIKEVSK